MGRLKKLCPILIPVLASIIIIVLFQSVFLLGYVPTASMEPTLKTGSLLLGLRLFDELETGDIIIFHHDGSCLVKRIVACEGDTLIHKDTVVTASMCSATIRRTLMTPGTGIIRSYLMRV